MAKFYGTVGFGIPTEKAVGVWEDVITEKNYYGDVLRNGRGVRETDSVNDELTINNCFSIVADPFANVNTRFMKYIVFNGAKWKITNVDIQRPRLILTVGGVYNG